MGTTSSTEGAQRRKIDFDELEAQIRAQGWLDDAGFWSGPPDHAELLAHAAVVFGSRELAHAWMSEPAMGLDWRCPSDLAQMPEGARQVSVFLSRVQHGVYT